VHASYDPAVGEGVTDFAVLRTLRVRLQREEVDVTREVEQRGPPPDVFAVRSPITTLPGAGDVTLGVRAVRFTGDGEEVVGCIQQTDVVVIDDAVNLVEVTLLPGECP